MVAVGSKSIPEKHSISLDLSKETEDNVSTELFSEIFSSETINNDPISKEEIKKDNDKTKLDGTKNNKKILVNIHNNPLDETQSFQKEIESSIDNDLFLEIKDENKDIIEYFGNEENKEIIQPTNKTLNIDDAPSLISTGVVLNKKSNISNENENSEEVNNNLSHHQHGNNFFNTPQTLTNSESKNKNKPSKGNEENIFNSFENNVSKPKKNVLEKDSRGISVDKDNSSDSSDNHEAEEVKIIKEDNTKIKKEDLKIDKQLNISNNNKEIISEKNTEKFFETKYLQSSNILSRQSKNNFSNQILLNNSGFEVNATNNSSNINYGSNGNQNGTQSNSSINNYQIYNDIKETLDMSDKRWASNLVSKINRSHASKINEIELHLSPKNLGKLKIKISVSNKTTFVKVSTDNAASSSMILNEENKLSEMFKEVGLELEDFSSENFFNQSFSNSEKGERENQFKSAGTNNSNDINDHENYTKDESLLNIKV